MIPYLSFLLSYLLGSIPSAVMVGKLTKGIDVRDYGSGNAGATNTFRVLGWKIAIPVLLIDVGKGLLAVELYNIFNLTWLPIPTKIILGLLAVVGHIFPLFAKFRGGKGIATLLGVVIALSPITVLYTLIVFVLTFAITNYISLSSILSGLALPIIYYFTHKSDLNYPLLIFFIFIFFLVIYTHRSNIKRLLTGTESKIFFSKKRKDAYEKK